MNGEAHVGTVCLTGDVHHMSLHTGDQRYLRGTEVDAAIEYARIAEENSLRVTLFVTGKAAREEREVRTLAARANVELGGHTYSAFTPKLLYNGVFRRVLRRANGPVLYQDLEIKKTVRAFKNQLGTRITSWRDHAYRHDRNTYALLAANGIRFVSDEVDPSELGPRRTRHAPLVSVPINILPDHDHVYHADITPDTPIAGEKRRDRFPPWRHEVEEWLDIVKEQVAGIVTEGGVATILVHPACMEIADGFASLAALCRFLSSYPSAFIRDLARPEDEGRGVASAPEGGDFMMTDKQTGTRLR